MSHPALAYAPARTAPVRPAARPIVGAASYGASAPGASPYGAVSTRYRDAELMSATPGQLIVMLFDKCLLTVRRAQAAFAGGDVAARVEHVCKAVDMVTELRASLDFEAGGDISRQLDSLYAFVLRELFEANRQKDVARLGPVLNTLGELREAFAGAQAQLAMAAAAPRADAPAVRSA
jgi:flagellar protein FliS